MRARALVFRRATIRAAYRLVGRQLQFDVQADVRLLHSGDLNPIEVMLHVGEGGGAESHVAAWVQPLATSSVRCAVLVRSLTVYRRILAAFPQLTVVYAKDAMEVEVLVQLCPALKAILYTSNTGNNIHLIRFSHVTHVFVGHGDSDKSASAHKFFRCYDEVWTAGRAHIDRFLNSGIDFSSIKFRIIGRPTLKISPVQGEPAPNRRFLYLPTWEGYYREQDYSSAGFMEQLLTLAHATCRFDAIVKMHPWAGKRDASLLAVERGLSLGGADSGHLLVLDRTSSFAPYVALSDFLLTDVSSVITDYLPSGKPIFVFIPGRTGVALARSSLPLDRYAYTFETLEQLRDLLTSVIVNGNDPLKAARAEALKYLVGVEETINGAFERELRAVAECAAAADRSFAKPMRERAS